MVESVPFLIVKMEQILKILGKNYEPSIIIETKLGKHDLSFKTNEDGIPVLLFIGKKATNGLIKGERYVHELKKDKHTGLIIKDHWEHKGKATP